MRPILARANRGVLERFASSDVLLAFDFDGTLAPIVRRPEGAAMRAATRGLLARLSRRYPCAIISGRARSDVRRRLGALRPAEVVGDHGIDPSPAARRARRTVRRWHPVLERRLAGLQGVSVERKACSLAVHYRGSRQKKKALAVIREVAASLGRARQLPGDHVLNLLPLGAPHKGTAVERVRERLGCATAIYVGDDATDEDVFALGRPDRLLSVRVGRKRSSLAAYYVTDQGEIDALLRRLLALRGSRRGAAVRRRGGR